jgi:hypothetical protein
MGVRVGNYVIHYPEEGKVWIRAVDGAGGEAGQFTVEQVEEALNELWKRYF